MIESIEQLKYPIGKYKYTGTYDAKAREKFKTKIRELPQKLRSLTDGLSEDQLQKTYRPDGWTVRQVVHHIADSHLNSIIRFKLGLTEDNPTIKPYREGEWAKLQDTAVTPIEVSIKLLEALHERWSNLLENFSDADWQRTVYHPERRAPVSLDEFLGLYAWHGEHHLEHIRIALKD